MKKNLRFYVAFYLAKLARWTLKVLKRNASYFPGKLAITICPDFLGRIDKPKTIIGVTGTNGKTTVCNILEEALRKNGYELIDNHLGSNVNSGIASSLIEEADNRGRQKKEIAVFELDERSAVKIYPYLVPTYLVCTNLFRDSLRRNAHTEFIFNILNKSIPKETKLILNGDDLLVSNLAKENERVYFGIGRLETDEDTCHNIVQDISICPNCSSKLEWEFVRYNHIGRAHCSKCDFCSPQIDYEVTQIDFEQKNMTIRNNGIEETYDIMNDNIINIYNVLTVISVLKELGMTKEQIEKGLEGQKIVDTRYSEEMINGIKVVTHLAKGLNPIACSRVFDYVRKQPGNKAVIMILDNLHDAATSSENTAWQYDTDYEFLNDDSIKQILIAGARYLDGLVRLEIADVDKDKIIAKRKELELVQDLDLEGIDKVFILHDLHSTELRDRIKEQVREKIEKERK